MALLFLRSMAAAIVVSSVRRGRQRARRSACFLEVVRRTESRARLANPLCYVLRFCSSFAHRKACVWCCVYLRLFLFALFVVVFEYIGHLRAFQFVCVRSEPMFLTL